MNLRKGDVVKRRGGAKRCEVLRVIGGWALLKPLAASAQHRKGAVSSLVVPLNERGMPEGYEVVK